MYKLAPLRILVTLIGVAVAFVFTLFPVPVTAKDLLRQDLGHQFQLLATIFGITHARYSALVHPNKRADSGILRHTLNKATLQYLGLQTRSTQNLLLTTWEPSFRYQFPRSVYSNLLNSMQRDNNPYRGRNLIVVFLTCTSFKTIASLVWKVPGWSDDERAWTKLFPSCDNRHTNDSYNSCQRFVHGLTDDMHRQNMQAPRLDRTDFFQRKFRQYNHTIHVDSISN